MPHLYLDLLISLILQKKTKEVLLDINIQIHILHTILYLCIFQDWIYLALFDGG